MKFKNKNHQAIFNAMTNKLDPRDRTKMSVLYLLTADVRLWNASKPYINKGKIQLDRIKLKNGNENAYALLCCAKDIAYGTSYLTVTDLADSDLISPKLYGLIGNAIALRRYGIEVYKSRKIQKKGVM